MIKIFGLLLVVQYALSQGTKPNIIVIIGDDLGFNDIGFHGSNEIPTPNIDALAYNGVILNGHYTQALCTPSRSAFLTGKYPIHLGMQHSVIMEPEPWGLPLNETLMPEYLRRNGYKTHAIGKWHLGFFKKVYTPTFRGFDTHFGYWQGFQDYYDHTVHASVSYEVGYDMRRNMSIDWDSRGKYSTTLFTEEAVKLIREHDTSSPMFMYLAHLAAHAGNPNDPLQAPDEEIAKFAHIKDPERRVYAAMVSMLDKSVGTVITALREKRMLENSIILFMSDNGAAPFGIHANHGSNYPLRGMKNSVWEGGQRGATVIWSPMIKKLQRVSNQLMHISDWLPTFYTAAGLNKSELPPMDGMDVWQSISEEVKSPRTDLLYNIDDIADFGGIRQGDWKYVYGSATKGKADSWYGPSGLDSTYHYDMNSVLESPVATSLAGIITFQQIRQKHGEDSSNYSVNLLDLEKAKSLREEATVKCAKTNPENVLDSMRCDPMISPCLFNIKQDPCEETNLASERPAIVMNLEQALVRARKTAVPARNIPRDPLADPARWNDTWVNWLDCDVIVKHKLTFNSLSPLAIGLISAACLAFLSIMIILIIIAIRKKVKSNRSHVSIEESLEANEKPKATKFFEDRERQLRQSLKDDIRTLE